MRGFFMPGGNVNEWILILTLVAGSYSSGSVTQVGPFTSKETCLTAANTWLAQARNLNAYERVARALCVPK